MVRGNPQRNWSFVLAYVLKDIQRLYREIAVHFCCRDGDNVNDFRSVSPVNRRENEADVYFPGLATDVSFVLLDEVFTQFLARYVTALMYRLPFTAGTWDRSSRRIWDLSSDLGRTHS